MAIAAIVILCFRLLRRKPGVDLAILTATEGEWRAVIHSFGIDNAVGSTSFWRGPLKGRNGKVYQVIVVRPPDKGNVVMGICTTQLLNEWHPWAAILVGIAAGAKKLVLDDKGNPIKGSVVLGDIVIGDEVWYGDRSKQTNKGPEQETLPIREKNALTIPDEPWHWEGCPLAARPTEPVHPIIHKGIFLSGEQVIASEVVRDKITDGNRKILAIEMETFGFVLAIIRHNTQTNNKVTHYLIVRGISDHATDPKPNGLQPYAQGAAAGYVRYLFNLGIFDRANSTNLDA